jgi:hypothetical protein
MGFRSPNNPKTLLRKTPHINSEYVNTSHGQPEIPNGQLVAILQELGYWVEVAVILNKVKHIGWVRRTYLHEA